MRNFNFGKFFVTLLAVLILTVGLAQSQTKTEWWGSAIQISLPNSSGDSFSINLEKECLRRTMSFSGTSADTLQKIIEVRCPSYGADSVRVVLGNYNLPMKVSFGQNDPIYCPEIFKMPHIITSGIEGDSIIIALELKGERNIMFFVNELAYKYNGDDWIVHHDFSVPSFERPNGAQDLRLATGEFLTAYQSVKFFSEGETAVVSYRLKRSEAIAVGDTLYFASFLGEKSSAGVVYSDDLDSNDLTCRVVWNSPAHLAGYFFNTTVYVAKKRTSQTGVATISEDMQSELIGCYPNPANPSTTITYNLVSGRHVTLAIYNIRGQEVTRLIDSDQSAGSHSIVWNGTDNYSNQVPSGVYICLLRAGGFSKKLQMTLVK